MTACDFVSLKLNFTHSPVIYKYIFDYDVKLLPSVISFVVSDVFYVSLLIAFHCPTICNAMCTTFAILLANNYLVKQNFIMQCTILFLYTLV